MEIAYYLIGLGILTFICSLIMFYDEYRQDGDKSKWHKNIFKALGYGIFAMALPLAIVAVIAIGANRESYKK